MSAWQAANICAGSGAGSCGAGSRAESCDPRGSSADASRRRRGLSSPLNAASHARTSPSPTHGLTGSRVGIRTPAPAICVGTSGLLADAPPAVRGMHRIPKGLWWPASSPGSPRKAASQEASAAVGVAECVARDAEADTTGGGSPSKLAAAVTRTTGPCGPCPQGSWAAGWCGLAPLPEASHAHPAPSPLPPTPPLPPLSPPPPLPPYQSNNQPPCGLRLFCCVSVGRSDRLIFDPVSGARSDVRTDGDIPPASALRRRPLDRANKLHPSIASALTSAPPNAASVASPAPPTSPVENIPASG